MSGETPAAVRRVDGAGLQELGRIHSDEVYRQMDWLLEQRPGPMDLYFRWERQSWAVQDLDLGTDARQWAEMAGPLEGLRREMQHSFTLFFIGEEAVTGTLPPLVHAAPDEQSRIFLSTQQVDEARHTVFFGRFFEEVVGVSGGLPATLEQLRPGVLGGFRKVFAEDLASATDLVRANPGDYGAWVEGVTIYHLMVEGMLALTGQKFLLAVLRDLGVLPGFYAGFTAVARDESRHVNFGVWALREAGRRDPALLDRACESVLRLLEPACRTIAAPERRYAAEPGISPENLRVSPYDVRAFSLNSLTKRLRVAGIAEEVLRDILQRGTRYYEAAWAEYEDLHGEPHPRRFWDRLSSAS